MSDDIKSNLLLAAGCVSLIVGLGFTWWPLAPIVGGLLCIGLAYVFALRARADKGKRP